MSTRRPSCCLGYTFIWNLTLTICFFERQMYEINCWNCFAIRCWTDIVLWCCFPYYRHWSLEIEWQRCQGPTKDIDANDMDQKEVLVHPVLPQLSLRQPLLYSGVCIVPVKRIDYLAKVFIPLQGAVISHCVREDFSFILVSNDSFRIIKTRLDSMKSPAIVLPILSVVFRGSVFKVLLAMLATMLSSELS